MFTHKGWELQVIIRHFMRQMPNWPYELTHF